MVRYRIVPRKVIPADYVNDLKKRIENLRRLVVKKNEEIGRLREKLIELAKGRNEFLRERSESEKERAEFEKERGGVESLKNDLSEASVKINQMQGELNDLHAEVEQKSALQRSFEEKINDYEPRIESLKNDLWQKEAEMEGLNEKLKEYLGTIAELNQSILERDRAVEERDRSLEERNRATDRLSGMVIDYEERNSEFGKYLLEIRDVKFDERRSLLISKILLASALVLGVIGGVFAVFANQLVLSMGMENLFRIKMSVILLGISVPLLTMGITQKLFASRVSVLYLGITGTLTAVMALTLFSLYYPQSFLHPFAGTVYFLYLLAIAQLFMSLLLALPKIHIGRSGDEISFDEDLFQSELAGEKAEEDSISGKEEADVTSDLFSSSVVKSPAGDEGSSPGENDTNDLFSLMREDEENL